MKQNRIIGITGNSGSGKTTVSQVLASLGAEIIDADEIAHSILLPGGAAVAEVSKLLGEDVLDNNGGIDRAEAARIVFADKEILQKHVEITHKYILEEIYLRISQASGIIAIDAPLLIESGLDKICETVWLVTASEELRMDRIMERDSLLPLEVQKRFSSQTAESSLMKYADAVIINTGSIQDLKEQVEKLLKGLACFTE